MPVKSRSSRIIRKRNLGGRRRREKPIHTRKHNINATIPREENRFLGEAKRRKKKRAASSCKKRRGNGEGDSTVVKEGSRMAGGCIKTRKRGREKRQATYRHRFRSPGETAKFPSMLLTINATRPCRECYLATCQPSYPPRAPPYIHRLNVALTGLSDVTPETLRRRRAQIICVQKRELEFIPSPNQRVQHVSHGRILNYVSIFLEISRLRRIDVASNWKGALIYYGESRQFGENCCERIRNGQRK